MCSTPSFKTASVCLSGRNIPAVVCTSVKTTNITPPLAISLTFALGMCHHSFTVLYDELFTTCFGEIPDLAFDEAHWKELLRLGSEHAADADRPTAPLAKRPDNDSNGANDKALSDDK